MLKKRKFKYGVFDRDGVLIDSFSLHDDLFARIVGQLKIQLLDSEKAVLRKIASTDWYTTLKAYVPQKQQGLISKLIDIYNAESRNIGENARLYAGVPALLSNLRQNGFKLFVSSFASDDYVKKSLTRHQIDSYFDLMLGVGDFGVATKDHHLQAIATFVQKPFPVFSQAAFYLSDAANDMAMAKRNNVFAVGITTTEPRAVLEQAGADAVIDEHIELLSIIKPCPVIQPPVLASK